MQPRPNNCELSLRTRASNLDRMRDQTFDIAIIGGGITGAGVALDAVARGFSVALIEKSDFASGTSSRSSKLIHGGLRYLKQFRFGLVRESLHERAALRGVAPHLSTPIPFLVPVYRRPGSSPLGAGRLKLGIGLTLYDLLAGRTNVGNHRWLEPVETAQLVSNLDTSELRGCFLYYDCVTDDSRLVIEVIKEASARGAAVANYSAAVALLKTAGKLSGIEIEDSLTGQRLSLRAKAFVNATGVWSDRVSRLSDPQEVGRVRPSKGVHIVVPSEKFNSTAAVLIQSSGEDRFLFVIPWQGRTLIGTTDSDYSGDVDDPRPTNQEIEQLVKSAARSFPESQLTVADVISSFAGLRPLVGGGGSSTTQLSREEQIVEERSGLISIIGGKLTTYRRIAERSMDLIERRLGKTGGRTGINTRNITLAGGLLEDSTTPPSVVESVGLSTSTIEHLMQSYGANYRVILQALGESAELKRPLVEGLPHIEAEAVYAARYEMAVTVDDFLSRRTRLALLARDHGNDCANRVAQLLRGET